MDTAAAAASSSIGAACATRVGGGGGVGHLLMRLYLEGKPTLMAETRAADDVCAGCCIANGA